MSEIFDLNDMHLQFATATFNATWDLVDKAERSADDDLDMLLSAATSRWHWESIGGPGECATGDWQIAHAASIAGFGKLALRFAERALRVGEDAGFTGWQLASVHEGMARAHAANGDDVQRDAFVASANAALEAEPDAASRQVIEQQLATIPGVA